MGKICMNELCNQTASVQWKNGWALKSGLFATLCFICGTAYEKLVYCDTFHKDESGWRECRICKKRIHCGCIASKYMHEYLDFGGIGCKSCAENLDILSNGHTLISNDDTQLPKKIDDTHGFGTLANSNNTQRSSCADLSLASNALDSNTLPPLRKITDTIEVNHCSEAQCSNPISLPSTNGNGEEKKQDKCPLVEQQESTPKTAINIGLEGKKKRILSHKQTTRMQSHLFMRYLPRVSDEELLKFSGDLNSTVVPLFEKVLTISDAGRTGRFVIPKACAEAYFPHISQSEGVPLKIQDTEGNEWTTQFRYWTNNNSRMYVLEGINPCIHSLGLHAGDTVIFSRIDPAGKLVMGFRKTSNSGGIKDSQASALTNEDAKKRTVTWKEALYYCLQPPLNDKPNIVMIEDHVLEEYHEPPVFGRKTIVKGQNTPSSSSTSDGRSSNGSKGLSRFFNDQKKRKAKEEAHDVGDDVAESPVCTNVKLEYQKGSEDAKRNDSVTSTNKVEVDMLCRNDEIRQDPMDLNCNPKHEEQGIMT